MAPERIRGDRGDGRADVYSLGVMLFEMLSGALPFYSQNAREVFVAHLSHPPPPLESPFGVLPRAVTNIAMRALAKRRGERQQSMREMHAEIEKAIASVESSDWKRWLP
jgi:serine/threonine-protein kinase